MNLPTFQASAATLAQILAPPTQHGEASAQNVSNPVPKGPQYIYPWQRLPIVQRLQMVLSADPTVRTLYTYSRRIMRTEPFPKNVIAAAHLFLARGLHDDAAVILLHYGLVEQAAHVYLSLQKPERAGEVYAGAARWDRAIACYGRAQKWEKAAQCAKNMLDFAAAARFYQQAGVLAEAAFCWHKAGELGQAFAIYAELRDLGQALAVLQQWRHHELDHSIIRKLDDNGRRVVAALMEQALVPPSAELSSANLLPAKNEAESAKADLEDGVNHDEDEIDIVEVELTSARILSVPSSALGDEVGLRVRSSLESSSDSLEPFPVDLESGAGAASEPSEERELADRKSTSELAASLEDTDGGFDYQPTWLAPTLEPASHGSLDLAAFFKRFSKFDRDELWRLGRVIDYQQGEVIVDFDDEPAGLYTVLEGDLGIFKDRSEGGVATDRVDASMSFGQFWAVMRTRSHVRILGNRPGKIHVIPRRNLVEALRRSDTKHAALRQNFMSALLEHLNGSIILKNA